MIIPLNAVEYMSYTLAKGLKVDKQYLQDLLTDQRFFEGKNVNCEGLNIHYSRCSNNIKHLEKVGVIVIHTDREMVQGLQLSELYLDTLRHVKPHHSYKHIKSFIHNSTIVNVTDVQGDLIFGICTLMDKYLPTGFGTYSEKEETSLYKTDFIIRSANRALSKYVDAYDTIHKVTLCLNKTFDCRVHIAIAQSLEDGSETSPGHMVMLKFPNDKKVTKLVYTTQQLEDTLDQLRKELEHQFN